MPLVINLDYKKGNLMLIEDHINMQGGSPLAFKNIGEFGERFVDMSEPYDVHLRDKVKTIAESLDSIEKRCLCFSSRSSTRNQSRI